MINEENYNKIISKNLKRLAYEHDKTQADIARDLGIWMVNPARHAEGIPPCAR